MKGQAIPTYTEEVHMETLALVLALLFIGEVIAMRGNGPYDPGALLLVALSFGGALACGIYVAVTA